MGPKISLEEEEEEEVIQTWKWRSHGSQVCNDVIKLYEETKCLSILFKV